MKEIKIDSGVQEYTLNEKCTVFFNPTDPVFAEKIYTAFEALQKKQEAQTVDIENMNARETFDYLNGLDTEMRETIDGVFGQPVCEALFGAMSVYASAGGAPVWMNLMLAIIDEFDESIKREKAFHSEKLSKYTKKYHR